MAFIRHTNCSRCGSSDANALYEGGSSFCFSCRSNVRSDVSPYVLDEQVEQKEKIVLPPDVSFNYSKECITWISKYELTIEELIRNKVYWSEEKQQLIFTFWSDSKGTQELLFWQARNFGKWARTKYITKGKPEQILPIIRKEQQENLCTPLAIVEDCVSAIKIARQSCSMPVLGSDLSPTKLKRLASVTEASSGIVVWLDGNMFHKAQRIAQRLQMLGIESRAIYTEHDPKEYSDEEIGKLLKCNNC